ncbi:oxygen-independent coproporphyrinogen III oxidase [Paenibacillus mucilaginosus 3016]|uniref:Heme chaperone HemW n=2 Tax=Paenibacillus mucilaginosus TaxID=61624 RepID=H6NIH8_9BACL|nr:radical SAM family heme chaperone HemW [Paenibacillus mucilaginosus]AFC32289.1 oxygen-independent coproporphyrinogen III oxidase [Paenibacillus mucilaginosus 3016]WFA20790.1 oxygen-independent coproporphyrinogen III oxidase [Paenibacillus mucilaginosus]
MHRMHLEQTPAAVYIHIPFCTNKCHYCDFNSYVLKGQPVMDYLEALEREMAETVRLVPPGEIQTIFVGGGTPTVLTPPQMKVFLDSVKRYFPDWSEHIEFTMEANPGTTDLEKLQAMREGGVNRISFGVQSFDNGLLEGIGRIHNTDDVYRSLENARKAGFTNLSIDLMFGLPGQTPEIMQDTLTKALALDLPHYSIYSLKVEENTLFHTLYQRGELKLPEEEAELEMFLALMERLKSEGYGQYEISNFARPGYESRHNAMYWRNQSYYGLGAGAHGYVHGLRHVNIKGVQPYIDATRKGRPLLSTEEILADEAMEDFMMVGLRMLQGVKRDDFETQFGVSLESVFGDVLGKLCGKGLLENTGDGYRLSSQGILLGNEVFGEFLGLAEQKKD